jgi:microcin C transport system substrate-binding protein
MRRWLVALLLAAVTGKANAGHAYAQFGDIKYPADFKHFELVNPNAPKGGELALVPPSRLTNFDKFNPFTLKGAAAPGLSALMFETLLTGTLDEPNTAYGLLAGDVSVATDGLSVTFQLRSEARFHNGAPVTAADVKHSFDTLMSKQAAPQYRVIFGDIKAAVVVDPLTVRFDFKRASAELPLLAGSLPVFSKAWGAGKAFDQVISEYPIGSGPYKIGRMNFGRDITYERDAKYWARDLNVRRGMYNFERVTFKIYKDQTARSEGFKAGEFDYMEIFSARDWARTMTGRKFDSGELVRKHLKSRNAGDFQGYLINTRRDKFKDKRVREALALAMDYEWMNRQLFYNSYTRVRGYFVGSDFEAKGLPDEGERELLEPLRDTLPPEVFTQPVPLPPNTHPPGSLRANLRKAKVLLEAAGWTYRNGALRNAKGEPFTLEYLDGGSGERTFAPYVQALAKLGIRATLRRADFALIQKRWDVFDFDITVQRHVGSEAPGSELLDRYGSRSAGTQGSHNMTGIADPAVDALLELVVAAKTRPELVSRLRALDRVLRHGHYVIPQWYAEGSRVVYRGGKFENPTVAPQYYKAEDWVIRTWWSKT